MGLKTLPIGLDNFEKIRRNGFYYADKTMFIAELLQNWGEVNLFTRPRRFGKSLNMSMLRSFFEIGADRELFEGLKICNQRELCDQYMGRFPVISISLKGIDGLNFDSAVAAMRNLIGFEALRFEFLLTSEKLTETEKKMYTRLTNVGNEMDALFTMPDTTLTDSLRILSHLLEKHYESKVIILIDEYDVPLDKAFQNGYYDSMVSLLRNLLGNALKGNSSLYFAVLTGCLRISKESIFTGLNNLNVMSVTEEYYEEYFGFTDEDVRELLRYFSLDSAYETIKQWYNGYRFGNRAIYCPWDVMKYCQALLKNKDALPEDYWANTSGNDMVKRFIRLADQQTRDEIEQLIAGDSIVKEINQELTYHDLDSSIDNLWSVLFTTGYLTVKERLTTKRFRLVIPNMEIRDLFIGQVKEWFREQAEAEPERLDALSHAFLAGDTDTIQRCLTDYLKRTISIRDTSVRKSRKENFYHGLLLGLLSYPKQWGIKSNEESGEGYSDILVRDTQTDTGIVIEVKYAENGAFDDACTEAFKQIESRNYAEALYNDGMEKILEYGIAFYKKRCKVMIRPS